MMEAAIVTAAPTPMPMQDAQLTSSSQSAAETGSFPAFLAAAVNGGEESGQETAPLLTFLPTSPEEEETVLAAELAALAFQGLPGMTPEQPAGDGTTTSQLFAPALTATPSTDAPANLPSPSLILPSGQEGSDTESLATSTPLPQEFQENLSASVDEHGILARQKGTASANDQGILNRQLQAILDNNPKISATLHPSSQNHPSESLNSLTSNILPSSGQNEGVMAATVTQETLLQGVVDGKSAADKMEGGRHSVDEQFISAKLEALSEQKNSDNRQQEGAQQGNNTAQSNTSALSPSSTSTEQGSHFLLNTSSLTPSAQTNTSTGATATTTTAHLVPADEIVNQLVERFSINPRLQTSKISLNLTPAELGSIKVDIMVQGDSIKAHIVAGSQQVQDTIEKQMPRLRSVLEQQGFTVDDFQVSLESATADGNDFFQQQFTSNQDGQGQQSTGNTPSLQETPFTLSLNTADNSPTPTPESGVNLNI